ncbi:hypothetical protein [Sorangium sp. So ce388]|uniref:hypothetical protein n=1 Tax=Sorangium sp. So ce388 TaxID=3133309 RepID=UPI003F5BFC6A
MSLFESHKPKWTTKAWAPAAQNLLSVTFSLWRAAFLAGKTGTRTKVFDNGVLFLERLIADNAISYTQDRQSNEWTFNYYTKNARASLRELHENWPTMVVQYEDRRTRTPSERWEYCQDLLDGSIAAFEACLSAPQPSAIKAQRREAKVARNERKQKSREYAKKAKADGVTQQPSPNPASPPRS